MTRPGALPTTSVLAVAFLLAACSEPESPQETTDPRLIVDETAYFENRLNGLWRYEEGSSEQFNPSTQSALYVTPSRKGTEIVFFLSDTSEESDGNDGLMLTFRPRPLIAGGAVYTRLNALAIAPANRTPKANGDKDDDFEDAIIRYSFNTDGALEIWALDTDDLQRIFNPIEPCGDDETAEAGSAWQELPIDALASRQECWPQEGGQIEFFGRFVKE